MNNLKKDTVIQDIIDMTEWKKKSQLLDELYDKNVKLNERDLRCIIKNNNRLFNLHKRDTFIAHDNSKGYIATTNVFIIKRSIQDNFKRSRDMLYDYGMTMKAIKENHNLKMDLQGTGLFDEYEFLLNEIVNVSIDDEIIVTGIITNIDIENQMYEVTYLDNKHQKCWFKKDDIKKVVVGIDWSGAK